jgi:hypothetical protein
VLVRRIGAEVDDAAPYRPPRQEAFEVLGHQQRIGPDIDRHMRVDASGRDSAHAALHVGDPGGIKGLCHAVGMVVHQHIHRPQFPLAQIEQAWYLGRIAQIGFTGRCPAALGDDLTGQRLCPLLLPGPVEQVTAGAHHLCFLQLLSRVIRGHAVVGQEHSSPLSGKGLGCRRPDAVVGASDQDNLVPEQWVDHVLLNSEGFHDGSVQVFHCRAPIAEGGNFCHPILVQVARFMSHSILYRLPQRDGDCPVLAAVCQQHEPPEPWLLAVNPPHRLLRHGDELVQLARANLAP